MLSGVVARAGAAGAGIERPLVQGGEEDGVVVAKDLLGAVAVVDVEVDDRDTRKAELGLGVAGGDGDVVDEAEAHRAVGERVVPGRPDERERLPVDRLERDPRGQRGRFPRRLGADRVGVEQRGPVDRPEHLEVSRAVDTLQLFDGRAALHRLAEPEPVTVARGGLRSDGGARARGWSGARQRLQPAREPAEPPLLGERGGPAPRRLLVAERRQRASRSMVAMRR